MMMWCLVVILSYGLSVIMLAAFSGNHNYMVWHLSVCPVSILTMTDMRCSQLTFRPDCKEDQHTCYISEGSVIG